MRSSQWLLGLATTSAIIAAVASGCGGSSNSGGSNDSGAVDVSTVDHVEAAAEAAAETGSMDAPPETAACVAVDADLTTIAVPDASLGDGGVNIATCVACLRSSCHSELEACNTDCVCIDTIINCVAAGAISLSCIPTSALTDPTVQSLGLCAESSCASACTGMTKPPVDGGEAGPNPSDGGDGG